MTSTVPFPTILRAPTPADHAAWLSLWRGYLTFYKATVADEVTAGTWTRLLAGSEPMHCALAYGPDGAAVGLVHWLTHRSTWTAGDYCYLQDLFVAESARGHGIGRRLIDHVSGCAEAAGCARVYWLTHETNHAAMALYDRVAERSGFVQYRKVFGPA